MADLMVYDLHRVWATTTDNQALAHTGLIEIDLTRDLLASGCRRFEHLQ